jgi:hypothetical protein
MKKIAWHGRLAAIARGPGQLGLGLGWSRRESHRSKRRNGTVIAAKKQLSLPMSDPGGHLSRYAPGTTPAARCYQPVSAALAQAQAGFTRFSGMV